jgi:hypothetical protein
MPRTRTIISRLLAVGALTVSGLTVSGLMAGPARAAVSREDLALRWAPIHHQDVDATGAHALGGRSDYLTRVDFDGDLNGRNNWDRTGEAGVSLAAHVYYSVARGHGLKAHPQYAINGDGIVYYPSTVAETPAGADDRDVRYRLIDIFAPGGLWSRRDTASLFAGLGTFAGDDSGDCGAGTFDCGINSANAPWGWDDGDDVPARGEIATDPAKLSAEYFTVPGGVSRVYAYNPYAGAADALRSAARTAPRVVD